MAFLTQAGYTVTW